MILYCIICYLFMIGMIVEDEKQSGKYKYAWLAFIFSPVLVPIFIGMLIQEQDKEK